MWLPFCWSNVEQLEVRMCRSCQYVCPYRRVCLCVCVCVLKWRHGWAYGEHRNLGIRTRHWACVCGSRACRTDKGWDLTRHCQSKKRAGHGQDSCTRWSTICIGGINGSSDPARWYKEWSRLLSPACKERQRPPFDSWTTCRFIMCSEEYALETIADDSPCLHVSVFIGLFHLFSFTFIYSLLLFLSRPNR